jgi:glycosyltransferase involved in cell wall biosynthesis
MSCPLVSVIIPCYRQGRFLASAVESVLHQSHPAVETIVVNDGSSDCTDPVAKRFGNRIRYTRRPNGGVSAARNCGIAMAKGDYLLFLDADDLLQPNAIRWLVDAAAGRPNPLCLMGNRHFENQADLTSGLTKLPPRAKNLTTVLLYMNFGPPHGYLCRRLSVLMTSGFDSTVNTAEDWDMWIRLVWAGAQIVPIHRIGAFYRQHPGSASRNWARMAMMSAEVLRRTLRRIAAEPDVVVRMGGDPGLLTGLIQEELAVHLLDAAYYLRQDNHYLQAASNYYASLRESGLRSRSFFGLCKLIPHKVLRELNLLTP